VAGEGLRHDRDALRRGVLAHRLEEGEARGEDRRLGIDGLVQLLLGAFEDEP
jgi:hypothetical protein